MEGALAEAKETDGGAADEPTTVNLKLPDETPTTWPALVECVTACFAQLCGDYGGGGMQYLNLSYPDAAAREKFGDWLTMQLVSEKHTCPLLPSAAARGVFWGLHT